MKEILKHNYHIYVKDTFLVQTRSQNKAEGVKLPGVHGTTKPLVPHEIPEKQLTRTRKGEVRREVNPILNDTPILIETEPKPEPVTQSQDVTIAQTQFPYDPTGPENRQTTPYIHPITRPPKTPRSK